MNILAMALQKNYNILLALAFFFLASSCSSNDNQPKPAVQIRIQNSTSFIMENVSLGTTDLFIPYEMILPQSVSNYNHIEGGSNARLVLIFSDDSGSHRLITRADLLDSLYTVDVFLDSDNPNMKFTFNLRAD